MQSFDLVNLAILWCIGLLALVQTVNARGAIRLSLSGIATTVIFIAAVFFTYLKVNDYQALMTPESQGTAAIQQSASSTTTANSTVTKGINSLEVYTPLAEKILADALDNIEAIQAFEAIPFEASESDREDAERKALSLRNQTAKVNQQAMGLFHPRSVSELHAQLVHATENLRLAGYSLHAYTTMEDESQKDSQREQYLKQAMIAKKTLENFQEGLKALNP